MASDSKRRKFFTRLMALCLGLPGWASTRNIL